LQQALLQQALLQQAAVVLWCAADICAVLCCVCRRLLETQRAAASLTRCCHSGGTRASLTLTQQRASNTRCTMQTRLRCCWQTTPLLQHPQVTYSSPQAGGWGPHLWEHPHSPYRCHPHRGALVGGGPHPRGYPPPTCPLSHSLQVGAGVHQHPSSSSSSRTHSSSSSRGPGATRSRHLPAPGVPYRPPYHPCTPGGPYRRSSTVGRYSHRSRRLGSSR
jgi:hypothetical protein